MLVRQRPSVCGACGAQCGAHERSRPAGLRHRVAPCDTVRCRHHAFLRIRPGISSRADGADGRWEMAAKKTRSSAIGSSPSSKQANWMEKVTRAKEARE